jgi:hypothetical protein
MFFPADVAWMYIAQEDPLVAWDLPGGVFAVWQSAVLGAPEDKGASVAGIMNDLSSATVQKFRPNEFAFMRAASQAAREK